MKSSLKRLSAPGIGIYIHWTLLLSFGRIFLTHASAGDNTAAIVQGIGFVLALFACFILY